MDKKVKELCQEYIDCVEVEIDTTLEKIIIPTFHKEDDKSLQASIQEIRRKCNKLKVLSECLDVSEDVFELILEIGYIQGKATFKK